MKFTNLLVIVLGLLMLQSEPSEAQQNLSVRPMRVEADVPPNRVARVVLTVQNRHAARNEPLNLEVVDLTQDRDGTLRIVTTEMRERMDPQELRASSRDWIQLPTERLVVEAGTTVEIPILLNIPPDARGAYAAAVRITTDAPPTPEATGDTQEAFFAVRFGFLIPLLTEISGRPVQQDIRMGELNLEFDDGLDNEGERVRDPATRVGMEVLNAGRTYSSLRSEIVVERRSGGTWRTVTRVALPERRILPGLTLELTRQLDRNLPPGEYRLLGNLSVDGRQLPRSEVIVDFEGDPNAGDVVFDTQLLLSPRMLQIEGVAGATRTATVEVENPGEQPLDVSIDISIPEALRGIAMGEIMGEQFSAAGWSQANPGMFQMRPGQRRNIRVVSRLPRGGLDFPHYFADIVLSGTYEDGQSAGQTQSTLRVTVQGVSETTSGVIDRFGIALGERRSSYIVQGRLINTGTVDITPGYSAALISATGSVVRSWRLDGASSRLLPLGSDDFSGEIAIDDVEPGEFFLRISAQLSATEVVTRQSEVVIEMAESGDDRVMELAE